MVWKWIYQFGAYHDVGNSDPQLYEKQLSGVKSVFDQLTLPRTHPMANFFVPNQVLSGDLRLFQLNYKDRIGTQTTSSEITSQIVICIQILPASKV